MKMEEGEEDRRQKSEFRIKENEKSRKRDKWKMSR
jgi:hypothetical protein